MSSSMAPIVSSCFRLRFALSLFYSLLQFLKYFLCITPGEPFIFWVSEQISRMESRHQGNPVVIKEASPYRRHLQRRITNKCLSGNPSQGNNYLRGYNLNLFLHKYSAACYLISFRVTVHGGPAFNYVRNIDVLSPKSHFLYKPCKERTCIPNKWSCLKVLLSARAFTYKHKPCIRGAFSKNDILPS